MKAPGPRRAHLRAGPRHRLHPHARVPEPGPAAQARAALYWHAACCRVLLLLSGAVLQRPSCRLLCPHGCAPTAVPRMPPPCVGRQGGGPVLCQRGHLQPGRILWPAAAGAAGAAANGCSCDCRAGPARGSAHCTALHGGGKRQETAGRVLACSLLALVPTPTRHRLRPPCPAAARCSRTTASCGSTCLPTLTSLLRRCTSQMAWCRWPTCPGAPGCCQALAWRLVSPAARREPGDGRHLDRPAWRLAGRARVGGRMRGACAQLEA